MQITSLDSLDAHVAHVVRLKIKHVAKTAEMETEKAAVEKRYAGALGKLLDEINEAENLIQDYCTARRADLFTEKKSRDTLTAVIGFELNPWRVATVRKKVTWKEVVKRLTALDWGKPYVRNPDPETDKDALLADRAALTEAQCLEAGIKFEQDEQFFIRPKSDIAADTTREAA